MPPKSIDYVGFIYLLPGQEVDQASPPSLTKAYLMCLRVFRIRSSRGKEVFSRKPAPGSGCDVVIKGARRDLSLLTPPPC